MGKIMSYIIVQLDKESGFEGVDAMINQEGTALQTFQTREEAAIFLAESGLRELEFGFPFEIEIQRIH